jgi:hypothetical protein
MRVLRLVCDLVATGDDPEEGREDRELATIERVDVRVRVPPFGERRAMWQVMTVEVDRSGRGPIGRACVTVRGVHG